jgi:hypothetical protein
MASVKPNRSPANRVSKRRFVQKQREPFAGILALLAIAAAQFDLTVEAFHQLRRTEPGEQSLDPRRIK